MFAETNRSLINRVGRVGCIVPSGIATDDTTKHFFQDLMHTRSLVSLFSFFEIRLFFPDTDSRNPFCLLTLTGKDRPAADGTTFVFDARGIDDLSDLEHRITLTPDDLSLLNPNTQTCPVFRWRRDAELNKAIYRRVPILIRDGPPASNPWGVRFLRMLDMANDSGLFRTGEKLEAEGWKREGNIYRQDQQVYLPLYEAKMLHHFDHRFSTYEGQTQSQANQSKLPELDETQHADPNRVVQPRYWVLATDVAESLEGKWDRQWLLGWRDICRNTDKRTVIASLLTCVGVGHKFPLMLPDTDHRKTACLYANLCSFALDYAARQKVGSTSLTFFYLKQFPLLPPSVYDSPCEWAGGDLLEKWLVTRVLELTYIAWDLKPFATDCTYNGPPFRWDGGRRFLLRCELDAAFFRLYGMNREETEFVLDTFNLVRRDDEKQHGEYRTKRVILEIYDAMAEAAHTGVLYQTHLQPPPADPRAAHPTREAVGGPTGHEIQRLRVMSHVVLLLRSWNKPVARAALEPAIVLMLNDAARRAILGQYLPGTAKKELQRPGERVRGLDGLLSEMEVGGFIAVETNQDKQVIQLGPQAPATDSAPAADVQRAKETLQALDKLGEDRVLVELQEIVHETYDLVS